jgi:ribosomal protein L19E
MVKQQKKHSKEKRVGKGFNKNTAKARTPSILQFLKYLDTARQKARPWEESSGWPYRFAVQ